MPQTRPVSVCVVSILAIALISQLRAQQSSYNLDDVSVPPPSNVNSVTGSLAGTAPLFRVPDSYGKLPISFEVNQGQADKRVSFLAHGGGYSVYLTRSEVLLSLHRLHGGNMQQAALQSPLQRRMNPAANGNNVDWAAVRMQLIGSNPSAQASGVDLLPGKANYLIGSDPQKWRTDVPTYAKVRLNAVYPGVDLVYYGNHEGRLEHDFVVAANADPNQIQFDLRDQDRAPSLKSGELSLSTKAGDVKLCAPLAYQMIGGQRKVVEAAYEDAGSGHIRFRLGLYDKQQTLVIDPVLVYSAVFGGSQNDLVQGIGIDSERNVYVAGYTYSDVYSDDPNFPLVDPYQSTPGAGYVSKLNPAGTALLYSTYLGNHDIYVYTLSVDAEGRAYIGGQCLGGDIPIVNAAQPKFGGVADGFISVLNPAGNAIEYSTYVGGPGWELVNSTAVDAAGNLYVTGVTQGPQGPFPASHDFSGGECASNGVFNECIWVQKYNHSGVKQYSILYAPGGAQIAADSEGSAYISGNFSSLSGQVPITTPGAYSTACSASKYSTSCGIAAKLSPAGDSLIYSTTLPTSVSAIQVDRFGNAYLGGDTYMGVPVSSNAFQKAYGGGNTDGVILKLNATGTHLLEATYLGGSGDEYIQCLALDQYDQVYVSGYTTSPNFPLKAPIQKYVGPSNTSGPTAQVFVTTLSPSLSSIAYYSTYFGTTEPTAGDPYPGAFLAIDPALNVYLAGTDAGNVRPTSGAYTHGNPASLTSYKVFASKLTIMDDVAIAISATPAPVFHGSDLTYTIAVTSKGPDFGVDVRVSDTLPTGTTFVSYNAGGGSCTAPAVGSTGSLHCTLGQLNAGTTWTVKLTVKVAAASGTILSDSATAVSNMQDFVPANNSAKITTKVD